MDALTRQALDKPSGSSRIFMVSDGVLTGEQVRRMAAVCRAQQTIPAMTQRILSENKKEPLHMTRA